MLKRCAQFMNPLLLKPKFMSSESIATLKSLLSKNLFSIELINKNVNRRILSMAYSPGVGAVCEAIKVNKAEADTMTLRPRSVVILTDGSMLGVDGEAFLPVMDWLIGQIKYYSGYDAFPFVVSKETNLEEALKDLAIGAGTVLYLDDK